MKLLNEKILLSLLVLISIGGYIIGCTHENEVLPPPSTTTPDINRGNGVFLPGNLTAGDTSSWKFDQAHSSVLWSANYLGAAGLLTGRFDEFGVSSITDAQKTTISDYGSAFERYLLGLLRKRSHKNLFFRICANEYFKYRATGEGRRMLFRICRST